MNMCKAGRPRGAAPKFPIIDAALEEKGGTYLFFEKTGVSPATYYYLQSGKGNPTKRTIDIILGYTGLTYEEAFQTKNADQRVQDADRR